MIIHADVLDGIKQIEDNRIHLVLTSPPYNIGIEYTNHSDSLPYGDYLNWLSRVWAAIIPKMVHGGRICINIGENKRKDARIPPYIAISNQLLSLGLIYRGTIIWNKNSAACHTAWGSWRSASNPHIVPRHEYILCYSKASMGLEDSGIGGSTMSDEEFMSCTHSVWSIGTAKNDSHPCPYPLELAKRLINFYTFRGQTILDPFAGTGTTGIAAAQLGRSYILIDNSLAYCRLMQSRLRQNWKVDEILEVNI